MPDSFVSVAIIEPFEGAEPQFIETVEELYNLMNRKSYSTDQLFKSRKEPHHYIHVRYWSSPQARDEALEDPDVHHIWARLGHLCRMVHVYQSSDVVFDSTNQHDEKKGPQPV
jgi:hypothetical protein